MKKIKKVILFSHGSAYDASSWSNIPYLMRESLEKSGVEVISINQKPSRLLKALVQYLYNATKYYDYRHVPLVKWWNNTKIKRAVKKHSNADFCIILNYNYYNKFNDIPTLLFHDWNLEMIMKMDNHYPSKREEQNMIYQNDIISKSNLILTIFSESQKFLKNRFPDKKIYKIDRNVINLLDKNVFDLDNIIRNKYESDYVLFIGRDHYQEGLNQIIEVIKGFNGKLKLKVIGIRGKDTELIKYYGWLKKDHEEQNKIFYDLIRNAKICVNTTKGWAGYSSIIEAMYYGTPIIVYPFTQFKEEFGKSLNFGFYSDGEKDDLSSKIEIINSLDYNDYHKMAFNAHDLVKDYTWDNYIGELIKIMENYDK